MHVLVLTETFPQLTETFVRRHVDALEADVFALHWGGDHPYVYHRPANVTVWRDSVNPEPLPHKILRRCRETVFGFGAPVWPSAGLAALERCIQERRPDVVLAEFAPNAIATLDVVRRHRIPLVTHFHGYDASSLLKQRRYLGSLPELFKASAAVIAVSNSMADRLRTAKCPGEKINVIPCGAALDKIVPRFEQRANVARVRFVSVGRMIEGKGPLEVVQAFARCAASAGVACHLTMIGEGPLKEAAKKLANRLGVDQRVRFAGARPHSDVLEVIGNSDVLVHHAKTARSGWIEGWGVAVAEGSAAGLPIVATLCGGVSDQVIDGQTGFLVPEGDWKAMGDRMRKLADNPSLRVQMGHAARKLIEQVGNVEHQIEKLRSVLVEASK